MVKAVALCVFSGRALEFGLKKQVARCSTATGMRRASPNPAGPSDATVRPRVAYERLRRSSLRPHTIPTSDRTAYNQGEGGHGDHDRMRMGRIAVSGVDGDVNRSTDVRACACVPRLARRTGEAALISHRSTRDVSMLHICRLALGSLWLVSQTQLVQAASASFQRDCASTVTIPSQQQSSAFGAVSWRSSHY
ncbi:hypothetical protein PaG_04736 [Moesziomyces aphidis]|uniref:Uncharacterized protein n=1 Tax=Moesziomyces aphidis TaxID=84754 RepID=W3VGQ0_MOEAP|nr:hypothetical protein PaG_04736 [Moesziomyces aphidis]